MSSSLDQGPNTIEDLLISRNLKEKLQDWINRRSFPNLIVHGPVGVGKSTLVRAFVRNFLDNSTSGFEDCLILNASEKTSIENVRNELHSFTEFTPLGGNPFRIIVLDEADNLSLKAQAALRGLMDEARATCRFIFISNSLDKIQEALISRSFPLFLKPASPEELVTFLQRLNTQGDLGRSLSQLKEIVDTYYPDIRKILTFLENSEEESKHTIQAVRRILKVAQKDPFVAINFLRKEANNPKFSIDSFCEGILNEIPTIFEGPRITDSRVFRILEALGTAYERVKNGFNLQVSFIYVLSLFKL